MAGKKTEAKAAPKKKEFTLNELHNIRANIQQKRIANSHGFAKGCLPEAKQGIEDKLLADLISVKKKIEEKEALS